MEFLDIATIAIIVIVVGVNVFFLIWLAGLPGRIARDRSHPQAEAINVLGWLSLVTLFGTWVVAFVWAYVRPANVRVAGISRTAADSSLREGGAA